MNDLPSSYASALYSLCNSKEEKQDYAEILKVFRNLQKENKDVASFLLSPDIGASEKLEVISKSVQTDKKLPHLIPFFATIIAHHRMNIFSDIVDAYVSMLNEELGILEGYVYSPDKLTPSQMKALEEGFYKKIGKRVVLKNILDPSLLGGVRVALGGKVYDSSIKGRLEGLRHHLKTGGSSL